ncbi:MAG: LysR family transcriptional regulator [Pseudomonadota bacterium]
MDKFDCMQAFVRVAETLSFAEAARQLNVTPSVITSRVKKLETYVASPLFHRSTRAVVLSEAGSSFFSECTEIVSHVDSALERMRQVKGTPTGVLRLQVLPGFALGHLGSALKDFSVLYPQLELDITVSDVSVNPVDKGFDVALQIFRPSAETLIERTLFPVRRVFCAAPALLQRHGQPRTPADLLRYRLGLYSAYPTRDRWTFTRGGEEISLQLPAAIRTNSVHMLRDYALSGGGITCLPTLVCGEYLLNKQLQVVLEDYEIPPLQLLAIYPATHRRALKVKLFIEFITSRFSGEPVWDRALRKHLKGESGNQGAAGSERSSPRKRDHATRRNDSDPEKK